MADDRIKLKESKKKDMYLDVARDLKTLWNMKVTVILIVISEFGTVIRLEMGLEDLEVRGLVKTIQTTAFLMSVRILRKVLETWRDLLPIKLQWKNIS